METNLPEVTAVIPHRPPFLFVEKILELSPQKVVGVRTFRADEEYFKGHFPDKPIVPGVLLMEGLAQTMAYAALTIRKSKRVYLIGIDRARFRGIVEPGKEVRYEVEIGEERMGTLTGKGKVWVDGKRVADAQLMGYAGDGNVL